MALELFNHSLKHAYNEIPIIKDKGIESITNLEDALPLLLPHSVYKSYSDEWINHGDWKLMTKWLSTTTKHSRDIEIGNDVKTFDEWTAKLKEHDIFLTCTSGTSGKLSIMAMNSMDITHVAVGSATSFRFGAKPDNDRSYLFVGCAPVANTEKNNSIASMLQHIFSDRPAFEYPVKQITIPQICEAVKFKDTKKSKDRAMELEKALNVTAGFLIMHKDEKLLLGGLWENLYKLALRLEDYAGQFNPDNLVYIGGGFKGKPLPKGYKEKVLSTFNIKEDRYYQNYSMQELNVNMPLCHQCGKYHVPQKSLIPYVLNEQADEIAPMKGTVTGRAAFVDLITEARWGGIITSDKITLNYDNKCDIPGPTIETTIERYLNDKISCSETIDALTGKLK